MSSNYYSPNSKNSGSALFVSFQSKEPAIFFKLLKQVGWDTKSGTASFKDGAFVNIKFSPDEAADFIRAVRVNGESKFYHQFNNNSTFGSFRYYYVAPEPENNIPAKTGFGLTVKSGETEFKLGLTLGGGERLMEYLKFALQRINEADYAADKKNYEERKAAKKTQEKTSVSPTVVQKKEPEPEPESGGTDGDLF